MSNETMSNETMSNETMSNETMSNETMSNRTTCPQCGRNDRIGRVRVVRECVDIPGGEVVRRDDPEWTHEYECGWCGWGEDVVGHCEACSRPILEDDDFEQWEDGPITHADCSVDRVAQ